MSERSERIIQHSAMSERSERTIKHSATPAAKRGRA